MKKVDIVSPTAIQAPFAINGDKNIPNYNATGTETSSLNLGFLPLTQEPLDDGGIAPERTDFNGMFYLSTDQRVFFQNGGFITYDAGVVSVIGGYPQDAILGYLDANGKFGLVKSLKDDNAENFVSDPTKIDGVNWAYVHLLNTDTDITNLTNSINTLSSQCVKLTGNQTISGTKTFNSAPIVPASTTTGSALRLADRGAGYIKFGDGTIIQWGHITMDKNNYKDNVSLPITFSGTYRVVFGDAGSDTSTLDIQKVIEYTSGKSFKVRSTAKNGDSFNWLAIGR